MLERKDAINHLYWSVEELKSYTDLTGNRFDIDNAQRRLWQMNPILKKHDFPNIQKLYNDLDELLEYAAFFDKIEFSKKVDELYELLVRVRVNTK